MKIRVISIILAALLLLPCFPAGVISAANSGITYGAFEELFEIKGAAYDDIGRIGELVALRTRENGKEVVQLLDLAGKPASEKKFSELTRIEGKLFFAKEYGSSLGAFYLDAEQITDPIYQSFKRTENAWFLTANKKKGTDYLTLDLKPIDVSGIPAGYHLYDITPAGTMIAETEDDSYEQRYILIDKKGNNLIGLEFDNMYIPKDAPELVLCGKRGWGAKLHIFTDQGRELLANKNNQHFMKIGTHYMISSAMDPYEDCGECRFYDRNWNPVGSLEMQVLQIQPNFNILFRDRSNHLGLADQTGSVLINAEYDNYDFEDLSYHNDKLIVPANEMEYLTVLWKKSTASVFNGEARLVAEIPNVTSKYRTGIYTGFAALTDSKDRIHIVDSTGEITEQLTAGYYGAYRICSGQLFLRYNEKEYYRPIDKNGARRNENTYTDIEESGIYGLVNARRDKNWYLLDADGTELNEEPLTRPIWFYDNAAFDKDGRCQAKYIKSDAVGICSYCLRLPETRVKAGNAAASGKITLSWNPVKRAACYKVYRSENKDGPFKLMKTTEDTSYTNTSAEPGTRYYYKVKAVCGENNGKFGNTVSRICDLPRPVVTASNVASSGKIKLTWEPVDGAVSYKVYRAESKDGPFKLMKTVTDGLSYTNTGAVAGQKYWYKVKAIHANTEANSAYSSVKSRTCDLPRPEVTITRTAAGKPKLTWKKVAGAVSYKVYRCETKTGTYKLMKTVTDGLSYTNTSAVKGKTYYYKVKAVHKNTNANSACSAVKSVTAR